MKNFTIFLFIMATVIFSLPMYSVSVWDGTADIWTAGSGTEFDPYQIATAQQFAFIAEMVNGGITTYQDKYFVLNDDIDLNNLEWTPIGSDTHKFDGVFDGVDHVIKNIKITAYRPYNGLFGFTTNTIKNLSVFGSIRDGDHLGGITGQHDGRIENCKSDCTVSATSTSGKVYAGGISGFGNGAITNCSNTGSVSSSGSSGSYAGGILGLGHVSITNCSNTGTVSSSGSSNSYAGGIVGNGFSSITNCSNRGSVSSSGSSGSYAGGISGYGNVSITNCSNTGSVSSSSSSSYDSYAGGISGYGEVSITNCSNTGSVSSSCSSSISSSYHAYAGGISGHGGGSITNCYNRGEIYSSSKRDSYSYGIAENAKVVNSYNVGLLKTGDYKYGVGDGTVTNSYYLETCGSTSGKGTKKTASAMRSVSFPIILNGGAETVFVMDVNNTNDGYPILAWQIDNAPAIVVSCNPSQGSTSGSGSYVSGSTATISATPNSGYIFTGWNDGDTTNPRTITVTGNAHYVALFEQAVISIKVGQDCTITQE